MTVTTAANVAGPTVHTFSTSSELSTCDRMRNLRVFTPEGPTGNTALRPQVGITSLGDRGNGARIELTIYGLDVGFKVTLKVAGRVVCKGWVNAAGLISFTVTIGQHVKCSELKLEVRSLTPVSELKFVRISQPAELQTRMLVAA